MGEELAESVIVKKFRSNIEFFVSNKLLPDASKFQGDLDFFLSNF